MVSAEQRWNESKRAHNRAAQAYHRALEARNRAGFVTRVRWSSNVGMTNRKRTQIQQKAQENFNRAQTKFAAATTRLRNAYRNLTRKYHVPMGLPAPTLNAILMNMVQNEKARARHRGRVRVLSTAFPPNVAERIARSLN